MAHTGYATDAERPGPADSAASKRRSAMIGAFFAEFVDMFDIYLPTVILAPALGYFMHGGLSFGMTAVLTSLMTAATLVGRPLGAVIFGALADRMGRRRATILAVSGFGLVTLLIALVPGYALIGISGYWILIVLRCLNGICLGGGYTGALPLAIEYAPKHRRGLLGGIILSGFPLAYIAITLVGLASFALFPLAGPDSPYAVWGWRLPFVVGALLAVALAVYYQRSVSESEVWESAAEKKVTEPKAEKKASAPLVALLTGRSGRTFLQVFTMMSGFWLTQNLMTLFVPTTVLGDFIGLSNIETSITLMIAFACLIGSYIGAGVLGQLIGRRRFFITSATLIATVGSALLAMLINGRGLPLGVVIVLVSLFAVIVTAPWGVILPYINERFHTDVRASGFGIGFSASVVLPSFYAVYLEGLGHLMPYALTSIVLLVIGAVLGGCGAAAGPETKDVDFTGTAA